MAWLDPGPWPGPVEPPVADVLPPASSSTTETVSNVAARSSVVPERLRSCDTCCTEPLVACDKTPAEDPSVAVTTPAVTPAATPPWG